MVNDSIRLFGISSHVIIGAGMIVVIISEFSSEIRFEGLLLVIILVLVIFNFFRTRRIEEKLDAMHFGTSKSQ